jgi:hypothetical protein
MSPDDQLSAFLGETPKQSRADLVTLEVMQCVERQAFLQRLVVAAGGSAVLALILWACAPVLNHAIASIAPSLAPISAVLVLAGAVILAGASWTREDYSRG